VTRSTKVQLLFITWVVTRVWAIASGFQISPYPNSEFLFSDVRLYDWWAGNIADGHFPINDPMWQYPPLAAIIFLIGYLIAGNTVGFVFIALLADLAIFLVLMNASKHSKSQTITPIAIWVATPILMGPIVLGRFDVFPTLAAVTALVYANSARRFGFFTAIGALLKVWPILNLVASPPKQFLKNMFWFAITFVAGSAILKLWWPGSFSFLDGQKSRGLQIESIGALPYMIWNSGPSATKTGFQFGAIEVIASGTALVSLVITVIGLVLLGLLAFWRLTGKLNAAPPADIALLAVLISMATSRVLSPQYMVWIFGLLAVAAFDPQPKFRQITTLLFISAAMGQAIYPWWYLHFQEGQVLATAAQVIRIVTLLWASALCWRNLSEMVRFENQDLDRAVMNSSA
jgi:hypothetical protein